MDATSPDSAAPDPGDSDRRRTQERSSLGEAVTCAARRAVEGEVSLTNIIVS